ncbi:MAG: carbohydrate binding family 9 domain-containing protein [Acidobacteria bacterium]|nr:carbohydrate binding family 9 domain-containing protein [Acidobacteriota bacterium]
MRKGILWAFLLSIPAALWGQQVAPGTEKAVVAVFTESKITIDGELNEPAWQTAEPAKDFIQRAPAEGQPATEWTEVRVLYDKEYLYVGVYCHDSEPGRLVMRDMSRDSPPGDQDAFGVVLDTFHDHRNSYLFSTSPHSGQRDTQFFNEGRDINRNWDGVWHVKARIQEDGWTIEYAIPFRTLRFSREPVQVWGVNFFRVIRRKNESSLWMPVPARYVIFGAQVSRAGHLRGLEGVQPGRNLKVKPFALAGFNQFSGPPQKTEADFDGGLDIKYGVTSGLTLDASLNTDFSQVEVDTQQVNLTRFPLFFPEKREFFLENAGLFQLGETYDFAAADLRRNTEALLFHSRRIGLTRDGAPIPLLAGARLTGRVGAFSLGFMNIQTRSEGPIPANNFTVARLRRNILANSDVGFMFLNRQSRQPRDYNRSFGADVNFLLFDRHFKANAVLAKTETPGRRGQDSLKKTEAQWDDGFLRFLSSYLDIQKNFNPEVGFVRRPGRRIVHNEFGLRLFQRQGSRLVGFIREIFPLVISDYALLPDSQTETKLLRPQLRIEFQDGGAFEVQYAQNFERLSKPFPIHRDFAISIGDYRFNEFTLSYSSDISKAVSGDIKYRQGDFFSGTKRTLEVGGKFRPGYHFSTSVDYQRNAIKLPENPPFATHLVGLRIDYSFNPRMSLNTLIQYNSDTNQISANIRFRLIHHPLSDLYLVYNESRDRFQDRNDRALTLKYTHLLNF